ncbi:MAG: hypothetical protein D6719_09835, partial [Candidatus Dadabacteria bacterium]
MVFTVLVLFAVYTLLSIKFQYSLNTLERLFYEHPFSELTPYQIKKGLEKVERLNKSPLANSDSLVLLARVAQARAEQITEPKSKTALLCKAQSAIGQALLIKPYKAQYLINWANLKQMLGSYNCNLPYTAGDYQQVTADALNRDPTNTRIMYAAALIYMWGKKRDKAMDLFGRVVRYDTGINSGQLLYILSQIESPRDFEKIVPSRFPQAAYWSRLIQERRPELVSRLWNVMEKKQILALKANLQEFREGKIGQDIFEKRLLSLESGVRISSRARQLIDANLAILARQRGDTVTADYLRLRQKLKNLRVIMTYLNGDTRPERKPLAYWGRKAQIYFDDFYR